MSLLHDTKHMHVFIDETASNSGDIVIVGVMYVPQDIFYRVDSDINGLRKRLLKMLKNHNYPVTQSAVPGVKESSRLRLERPRIRQGVWPEIHAQEIWNGTGAFSKDRSDLEIFSRHIKLLEEILDIFRRYGIYYRTFISSKGVRQLGNIYQANYHTDYSEYATSDINRSLSTDIQRNIYVTALAEILITIDEDSREYGWTAEIVCDAGQRNEIFQSLDAFEQLRSAGAFETVKNPVFVDSHSSNHLQLCDAITFIFGKYEVLTQQKNMGHKHFELLKEMNQKYIEPKYLYLPRLSATTPMTDRQIFIMEMFRLEFLFLHSGGLQTTYDTRRTNMLRIMQGLTIE